MIPSVVFAALCSLTPALSASHPSLPSLTATAPGVPGLVTQAPAVLASPFAILARGAPGQPTREHLRLRSSRGSCEWSNSWRTSSLATQAISSTTADDLGLKRFRLPYEQLLERTIGTTTKPVRFDWRKTSVHLAANVAQPIELNNFNTFRAGALARFPNGSWIIELGLSYAWVFGSESSRQLSLTPYRQPGRPPRAEIDFSIGLPLAEGVVTVWPDFFPAVELVFSLYGNLRYLFYPTGYRGVGFGSALIGLLSPTISDAERQSLDQSRLPGMEVDVQRYHLLAGFGTEIYFQPGFFIAPRVLLEVPIIAAAAGSDLTYGIDFSISLGVAF